MDMKECKYENLIDEYLLNRLPEEKIEMFENHYFNCSKCFEKIEERNALIAVVKTKGNRIFQNLDSEFEATRPSLVERLMSSLTPRQWGVAAIAACALLIVFIGIGPIFKSPAPQFVMDSQSVRGASLALLSPVDTIQTIPSQFRWANLGEGIEYKFFLYKKDLLWSASTTQTSISLPDDVKDSLKAGENYSWQVKAYSKEGSLIATSTKASFLIYSHL